jgi:hypothetical protein
MKNIEHTSADLHSVLADHEIRLTPGNRVFFVPPGPRHQAVFPRLSSGVLLFESGWSGPMPAALRERLVTLLTKQKAVRKEFREQDLELESDEEFQYY